MISSHFMKLKYLLLFGFTALFNDLFAQDQAYFTTHPTLSPDGKMVVFSYEGDLWKAGVKDGLASRLTAMQGEEINPRISPDGKWLAFSSNQLGNYDVYVMPLDGGDIKQLTFHDAADEVDSWSWDSKTIYFTSGRYNRYSGYKVPLKGGSAERLFPHYFNTTHHIVEAPNGELYFSDTWESKDFAQRKRYKGAFNPEIQSYHPKTKAYKKYTDYIGKDFWTSIDQNGKVYFVSDEANNEYNLYTFINGVKTRLTQFNTSVKRPFVAANGDQIVFEKDYQLYLYNVASKKSERINIKISRNQLLQKEQDFNVQNNISAFDVSPDGKKIAFIARGEILISDIDGKFISKLERSPERAMEVKWLSDSKTLLFSQTFQGYQNWFTMAADGKGEVKQITKDQRNNRDITINSKRTMAVYLSGRDEVRILDLKSFASKTVVKDEIWAVQSSSPSFSPNDEYVLFTAHRNFEKDIFIHHLKQNKTINLTNTGVSEASPIWSPDSKYIYFTSSRTKPSYPFGMQDPHVYRMALDVYDEPFRSDKLGELFDNKKEGDKKDTSANISINVDGLLDRIDQVGPNFGAQYANQVIKKGDKTYVFFTSNHSEGNWGAYRTILEPFESAKTERVSSGGSFSLIEVGDKHFSLINGVIHKYNLDRNDLSRVDMNYKFSRNLSAEFNQMYEETWAGLEENFYDEEFHGIDWPKMKKTYAAYLPYVNSRNDLRVMLNDLLGELNSSHMGFNTYGDEERKTLSAVTNEVGILFDQGNPYKVDRIVAKSNADRPGVNIQKGDELISIDGKPVDKSLDRDYYFTRPSLSNEISLEFNRDGKTYKVKIRPQSSYALRSNLYDEWIRGNRAHVDLAGNKRIAYAYMKNMGGGELDVFLNDMVTDGYKRDALILDLRYNTGGNVHDEVLKFLSQRPYLQWKYRGGQLTQQGNFTPAAKPIVLLINEQSLSDAEMTAAGFKSLKLGTIIGTDTYRWIIFTSGKGLVDGSSYRLPAWGCYTFDGKNIEKEGVQPDKYIKTTFTDRLEGKDPQLDAAIKEILNQLK
jgi:tricorn protease